MSAPKRPKQNCFKRGDELNCSLRLKEKKKRIHEQLSATSQSGNNQINCCYEKQLPKEFLNQTTFSQQDFQLDLLHVGLQERLDKEIKIRDGATRLISACTHENQLLEAAKTLLTSNARTFAYLAELQKLKAAEVLDTVTCSSKIKADGFSICKGRIAISEIRIPLLWKDYHKSNKLKDTSKHAVFCVLTAESEVQDTELVCIDRATTDISFSDVIVFERISHAATISLEVFSHPMSSSIVSVSAATPQKLLNRLNRTGYKEGSKRGSNRTKVQLSYEKGPQYKKIARLLLTLDDIDHVARSRDIEKLSDSSLDLPLYDSIMCRLAAQPNCMTEVAMSGFLHYLEMISSAPSWSYLWCELKSGFLRGWKNPEEASYKDSYLAIDILAKDIKTNQIEKSRQKRANSFQVRDFVQRFVFAADSKTESNKWIRGIRQHKTDYCAWGSTCRNEENNREPMFIASPRKLEADSDVLCNLSFRKNLIYDQLNLASPTKALSDMMKNKDEQIEDEDTDKVSSIARRLLTESEVPWASLFTGGLTSATPSKNLQKSPASSRSDARLLGYAEMTSSSEGQLGKSKKELCSEASGSDDAFLSESEDSCLNSYEESTHKKRLAPQPPTFVSNNYEEVKPEVPAKRQERPPSKPPLPKLPVNFIKKRRAAQTSVSSASSLDDILEERSNEKGSTLPSRTRTKPPLATNLTDTDRKPPLRPAAIHPLLKEVYNKQNFLRSQSVDEGFGTNYNLTSRSRACSTSVLSTNKQTSYRPSPGRPQPTPRRSYLHAVENSQRDVEMKAAANGRCVYRQLSADSPNVFRQSELPQNPPKLPPKEKKLTSAGRVPVLPPKKHVEKNKEPLYARVDIEKKRFERARKVSLASINEESLSSSLKSRSPLLNVCKK